MPRKDMVTKLLLAAIFLVSSASGHFDFPGYPGYFSRFYGHHESPSTKQKTCGVGNACPTEAVCCLKGYQGRCYYGSRSAFFGYTRTKPVVSNTCIKEFGDGSAGSRCSRDSDCNGELVCDELKSNKWGFCREHICDSGLLDPCNGHECNKDSTGPGYTCNCLKNTTGSVINDQELWKKGKYCDEAHRCAINGGDCGDYGTCYRDSNDHDEKYCACEDEWFGEKCNWEGACQKEENMCDVENGAVCTSLGVDTYECDCTEVPGKNGPDCLDDACEATGGCGTGLCTVSGDGDATCLCPPNFYGPTCATPCGGNSVNHMDHSSPFEFTDADAMCVWENFELDAGQKLIVMITGGDNITDPFCYKYYIEVYEDGNKAPSATEDGDPPSDVTERYCKANGGDTKDDSYIWSYALTDSAPLRLVLQAAAGQSVTVAVTGGP